MTPDPLRGHLSDHTPAAGHDLSRFGLRPGHPPLSVARSAWEAAYARWVVASDVLAVATVSTGAGLLEAQRTDPLLAAMSGLLVAVAALVATYLAGAWDPTALGDGGSEYRTLVRGFVAAGATLGLAGLAARLDDVRSWVFVVIPVAGLLAVAGRVGLRAWLHSRRRAGECLHAVLAVGSPDAVADLVTRTRQDRRRGWAVTAACTPTGTGHILGVPVVGDLDAVAGVARRGQYRVVSVGPADGWTSARLHRLAWDIDEIGAELVVDPRLVEVAGPRLRTAPVDGLPLVRTTRPTLGEVGGLVKAVVDRLSAAVLLLLLAPLMVGIAFAVRSGGAGVLNRETRIGRDGRPFTLLRFRSTVADPELRVTAVGAWMRRYALDELPQLLNVLGGSMSLVGPRPPLPAEVVGAAPRSFPVKPGITGLWQVGGDVALSWEESARLDLRYVQHWSLIQDAVILGRTVGAIRRNEQV